MIGRQERAGKGEKRGFLIAHSLLSASHHIPNRNEMSPQEGS